MNANNDRTASRALARQRRAEEKAIHEAARAERLRLLRMRAAAAAVNIDPAEWKSFNESPNLYIAHGATARDTQLDYLRGRAVTLRDHALKRAKFYANACANARSDKGKVRATFLMNRAKQRAKDIYAEGMREFDEYIKANPAPAVAAPSPLPLPPLPLPPLPY